MGEKLCPFTNLYRITGVSSCMVYTMDYTGGGCDYGYSFLLFGLGIMLFLLVITLIIAYLVYKDANSRGMNGLLWGILVLLPMVGLLFLVIYIIIRETGSHKTIPGEKCAMDILKERYAKGEITSEQFQRISDDLKK
jgi:putative membrane protein